MQQHDGTVDRKLARIAARQHGLVTRGQLLGAGVTPEEIRQRLLRGSLIAVHPGVYRVGHEAPSREATYLAAVLACGADAVLCGRSAGHLLGVLVGEPPSPEVSASSQHRIAGVTVHRARAGIDPRDTTIRRWIPVTTVARTLVDLAATLCLDDLAQASHEAWVKHRTSPAQIEDALARRPKSPGAASLRAVVNGDAAVLLSKLERGFRKLLREQGLPLPITNRPAGAHYVDCRWPDHKLTVELDSYAFHNSRRSWKKDRRREREAYARGDEFRRYTWGDVFEDREPMLGELFGLLKPATARRA